MGKEHVGERKEGGYNVVFRSKESGVITWSRYESKSAFDAIKHELSLVYDVLVEGITEEACVSYVKDTPDDAYTREAFLNGTNPDGSLNAEVLHHELEKAGFAVKRKGATL